jgi:FO synthase
VERGELLEVPLDELCAEARRLRAESHGSLVTYSPKVFVPLTTLCRDVCHYCTFARPPRRGERAYMTIDEVLDVARAGAAVGCGEALFTLGDKPELRYRAAREELAALGCDTTLEYLARAAGAVLEETGLLPHLNPGVMTAADLAALRPVAASMGIMLETLSERLSARGGPHFGSPDKLPAARVRTLAAAGEARVPFTTGILIGIGETRAERIEALLAIRELGERHGHVQEVIVQNFRAKPGTRMADAPEPPLEDLLWTVAVARILLGPGWHVQAPPNLSYGEFPRLLDAGIDDWGGVSPVTIDHVNPEAPWPEVRRLEEACRSRGLGLAPRLPVYPEWLSAKWLDAAVLPRVLRASDALGLAREDGWAPGETGPIPFVPRDAIPIDTADELGEDELVRLFRARGEERQRVLARGRPRGERAAGGQPRLAHHRRRRPARGRVGEEVVPVEALAGERHEQAARADAAGVRGDAADLLGRRAVPAAAQGGRDLVAIEAGWVLGHGSPSARRASSRSSRWRRSAPTIW